MNKRLLLLTSLMVLSLLTRAQHYALIGMTYQGSGASAYGAVIRYDMVTKKDTVLDYFTGPNGHYGAGTFTLNLNDNLLYGMVAEGGTSNKGVLFSLDPITGKDSVRINFNGTSGGYPYLGALSLYNNMFYGMTSEGGTYNDGVIFSYNPATNAYNVLYNFGSRPNDGILPNGAHLTLVNGKFYGVTVKGGASDSGTVFAFNPQTGKDSILVSFKKSTGYQPFVGTLTLNPGDSLLYGATSYGDINNEGNIYTVNPKTGAFNKVITFSGNNGASPDDAPMYNSIDQKLYGLTYLGGSQNRGVLYRYDPVKKRDTVLYNFNNSSNDAVSPPNQITIGPDSLFYGVSYLGGSVYGGAIFRFNPKKGTDTVLASLYNVTGTYPYGSLSLVNICQPIQILSQPASAAVCLGNALSFTTNAQSKVSLTYQWMVSSNGSNFTSISNATSSALSLGIPTYSMNGYKYKALISNGCNTVYSNTVTLTVDSAVINIISMPANDTICKGDPITLTAKGSTGYVWNNGITNGTKFLPSTSAKYIVNTIDSNGCAGGDSVSVTVKPSPAVTITGIDTIASGTQDTLVAHVSTTNFVWNAGSTKDSIIVSPLSTETYTVIARDTNGCVDSVIFTVNVIVPVTVNNLSEAGKLSIYPVPASNALYLNFTTNGALVADVDVIDMQGNTIMHSVDTISNKKSLPIDISALAQGTYMVRVTANKHSQVVKFIK